MTVKASHEIQRLEAEVADLRTALANMVEVVDLVFLDRYDDPNSMITDKGARGCEERLDAAFEALGMARIVEEGQP